MTSASMIMGVSENRLDHVGWMLVLESHLLIHGNVFYMEYECAFMFSFNIPFKLVNQSIMLYGGWWG